ncbi:hypothetical protein BD414DRAFT_563518 [Trametes punicea]|nr:hypothetical protein BD414DRAFT_563518 [Trametes punicea]
MSSPTSQNQTTAPPSTDSPSPSPSNTALVSASAQPTSSVPAAQAISSASPDLSTTSSPGPTEADSSLPASSSNAVESLSPTPSTPGGQTSASTQPSLEPTLGPGNQLRDGDQILSRRRAGDLILTFDEYSDYLISAYNDVYTTTDHDDHDNSDLNSPDHEPASDYDQDDHNSSRHYHYPDNEQQPSTHLTNGGTVTQTDTVTDPTSNTVGPTRVDTSSLATNLVTTTFQSTVFVTTTNSAGQTITSAPPFITETLTSTNSDGSPSYVTIVVGNPTPITTNDNATQTSEFFRNKGAVAGVFLIVGLAAASIVLFIFFYIRRRRRTQRLEHDAAVASTLAAAGFNRRPLDGDDDEESESKVMSQRPTPMASGTLPSLPNTSFGAGGQRPPSGSAMDDAAVPAAAGPPTPGTEFDPYAAYGTIHPPPPAFPGQARRDGYAPARTSSPPPPGAWQRQHTHSTSTSASSMMGWGHAAKGSVGSHEPLLSGYYAGAATEPSTPALGPTLSLSGGSGGDAGPPAIPPRDPRRVSGEAARPRGGAGEPGSSATSSSVYSAEDSEVPEQRRRLEVRNLPEGVTLGDISREPSRRG